MSGGRLKGGPELLEFLALFPARVQKNALRSAMIAGARVIRDEARATVPDESGKLRKAIKTSSPRAILGDRATVKVKLLGEHSYIGTFLEYGVAPHVIGQSSNGVSARALNRRARVTGVQPTAKEGVLKIGEDFVGGVILHPGFAPKPFMRPALDRMMTPAVAAIGARLAEYLKDKTGFSVPDTLEPDEVADE